MKVRKYMAAGLLTAAMLLESLFAPGMEGLLAAKAAQNVALNKPVEVSALERDGQWTGDLAVDGDSTSADSRWSGGNMKATADAAPQWLTIDLKAEQTTVESIKISFYLKVWSTDYVIQTRAEGETEWRDLHSVLHETGSTTDLVDTIPGSDVPALDRYVRFYFKELNPAASGNAISIREIEITGTQSGVDTGISSAQDALNQITGLNVAAGDTSLSIPQAEGYDIEVHGSEAEQLIDGKGQISACRIADRQINVILKATAKGNPADTAKKSFTVTVPANTAQFPELFPQIKNPNPAPKVLPSIQEWYGYEGNFTLTDDTAIVVNDAAGAGLMEVAEEMKKDLAGICGTAPQIRQGTNAGASDIYLESQKEDSYGVGDEGYLLVNGNAGLRIYAPTKTGVLYGTVTAEQILYQDKAHTNIPKGVIRDYPLYGVRGIMFDIARIPTRLPFLEDYTKILKWYKLNTMQLHINDNQWSDPAYSPNPELWKEVDASHRVESELFPSLAKQISKFPKEGDNPGRFDYYFGTHTGREGEELYYTKDEYRNLEALAGTNSVKLVAELDTPGHSAAYNKYVYYNQEEVITSLVNYGYLERGSYLNADGSVKEGVTFYTHNPNNFELLAIDDESTNETVRQRAVNAKIFMKALFDEYMGGIDGIEPLFTTDTVNAGVDEYWDKSGNNKEAFRRYMNDMYDLLGNSANGYGKEVYMWGSLEQLPGSTKVNNDITLFIWNSRGEDNPVNRMNEGFSVINIPQLYLYTTPGRFHKDMIREDYVYYNWEPELFDGGQRGEKGEPLLLGAMGALWGDENREGITEADLNERYLRLGAMVSEKTWGGAKEGDTFLTYEQTFDRLKEGPGTKIANEIKTASNVVIDYDMKNLSRDGKHLYDASGNGYHGLVTGGSTKRVDGETLLKFNGGTKIETPLETLGYPYTVSFDLYLDGTEANDTSAALFSGYDGRLKASGFDGALGLDRDYFTQSFGYTPENGEKHKITIVGTYQATKLYVDGEFKKILYAAASDPDHGGSIGAATDATTDAQNNFRTTFVFPMSTIGENFSGYLGNIKAYNKALSTEELLAEGSVHAVEADVARNCPAYADNQNSNYLGDEMRLYPAWKATDGDGHVTGAEEVSVSYESRWYSSDSAEDFLMVDLGQARNISKVVIDWEASRYAAAYDIQVSEDGQNFKTVKSVTGNTNAMTEDSFGATKARYVKMQGVQKKAGAAQYAIFEIKVYETVDKAALHKACQDADALLKKDGVTWGASGVQGRFFESVVLAKAVRGDVLAGQQETDTALAALNAAKASYASAGPCAAEAEQILSQKDLYDAAGWAEFEAAYQALLNAGKDITEAEYQTLVGNLTAAMQALTKKTVTPGPDKNEEAPKVTQLAAPAVLSVKSQKTKVRITWSASEHAASYQLYRKAGSKVTKVGKAVAGTTAYDENPVKGTMNYYVMALSGGQSAYTDSAAGQSKSIKLPSMVANAKAVQVKGKKAVSISWKKASKTSSYLIYRAEGKKGTFKKIATVKRKNNYRDSKKLKKGKTYYYKIVTVSGGKYSPMKAANKGVKIK